MNTYKLVKLTDLTSSSPQPHWPLVYKAVLELPHVAVQFHDIVDLPGVSDDAGPFGVDALAVSRARVSTSKLLIVEQS